jgi:hypothetical protein
MALAGWPAGAAARRQQQLAHVVRAIPVAPNAGHVLEPLRAKESSAEAPAAAQANPLRCTFQLSAPLTRSEHGTSVGSAACHAAHLQPSCVACNPLRSRCHHSACSLAAFSTCPPQRRSARAWPRRGKTPVRVTSDRSSRHAGISAKWMRLQSRLLLRSIFSGKGDRVRGFGFQNARHQV